MPIKVGNQIRRELDILKRYYSRSGAYEIPMREIDSEVLHALLTILKRGNYFITGIFCEDGNLDINHTINPETDYYLVNSGKDILSKRFVENSDNKAIILAASKRVGLYYNEYLTGVHHPRYRLKAYFNDEPTQNAVDEIIYKGMFNTYQKEGYSIGLTIENVDGEDCFVFYELQDVGC